jgi:hypothetical protein
LGFDVDTAGVIDGDFFGKADVDIACFSFSRG